MLYYDTYGNEENPTMLLLHGAGALDRFNGARPARTDCNNDGKQAP